MCNSVQYVQTYFVIFFGILDAGHIDHTASVQASAILSIKSVQCLETSGPDQSGWFANPNPLAQDFCCTGSFFVVARDRFTFALYRFALARDRFGGD